jgi:hypothetical protein
VNEHTDGFGGAGTSCWVVHTRKQWYAEKF